MSETTIERHASIEARASVEADSILKYFKKCDYITSLTGSDLNTNKGMYLALSLVAFAQSEVCRELARLRIEMSTTPLPENVVKVPFGAAG